MESTVVFYGERLQEEVWGTGLTTPTWTIFMFPRTVWMITPHNIDPSTSQARIRRFILNEPNVNITLYVLNKHGPLFTHITGFFWQTLLANSQ